MKYLPSANVKCASHMKYRPLADVKYSPKANVIVTVFSFAAQKNDMLLRNMIYLLNANMIGSTDVEHDMFVFDERCSLFWPMFLL